MSTRLHCKRCGDHFRTFEAFDNHLCFAVTASSDSEVAL